MIRRNESIGKKKCATAVIGSNQEDGVAAWLRANVLAAEA